jgi:hypothetical protein
MDASPYAPPDDHPLVVGENAAAIFSLIGSGGERTEAPQCRHKHPPKSESPFALAIDEIPDLCVLPKFR